MFVEQLRQAVEACPRHQLTHVNQLLWRAYAAGQVTEEQASELSDRLEARRAAKAPQSPVHRRVGSRPRSGASMERRRRWAASGALPPALAARFTLAETAVLAVVAAEALRHGRCTLVLEHIAALAGVGRSTVKRALRAAQGLGFVRIEERRVSAWRNAPNVVTITSREWSAWLRMRGRGVGFNQEPPRLQEDNKGTSAQTGAALPRKAAREAARCLQRWRSGNLALEQG